jgi:CRISPR-associated RAMP protein (TIGR02581 family)
MLKQLMNECLIELDILPKGPILIKSGVSTISGPDMAFVRVWRNGGQEVYLPGSSLKGVLRSHAERIARTLQPDAACDPFADEKQPGTSCGHCFDERKRREEFEGMSADALNRLAYSQSCPICRLFGSTWYAGRLATADAYARGRAPQPQPRDGVGIDRFTGGAAGGVKFDLEVITEGRFATTLHLRNFEVWQLGLLGFLLQDLKDGLLRVGASKSRGLGRVEGDLRQVRLYYLGRQAPQPEQAGHFSLWGAGELAGEQEAQAYGMQHPDRFSAELPQQASFEPGLLRHSYLFPGDSFPWEEAAQAWVDYAAAYSLPQAMADIRTQAGGRP